MHWKTYDDKQRKGFEDAISFVEKRLVADSPDAIIFKGSRTNSPVDDSSDIDMIIVKRGAERSDKLFGRPKKPILDITIIDPDNLESSVCAMHSDSYERTAMLDLSYILYDGDLGNLEEKMKNLLFKDFHRFVHASYPNQDKTILTTPENLILYPLMLDLHRMPNLLKSARHFLKSPYLSKNLKVQSQDLIDHIEEGKNDCCTFDGTRFRFNSYDYHIESLPPLSEFLPVPELKDDRCRSWPSDYYAQPKGETSLFMSIKDRCYDYIRTRRLKRVNHLIDKKNDQVLFDPNLSEIIKAYR